MKIQSLSIVVPNKVCINNCKFCVSRMHTEDYPNNICGKENQPFYEKEYLRRLEFARDNGCNSVVLTGQTEPQQNMTFLKEFGRFNNMLPSSFKRIDIQTTGVGLDEKKLLVLRDEVGVNTISLSLSSFDSDINMEINGTPEHLKVNIPNFCELVKKLGFNLRLSLNLSSEFGPYKGNITEKCRELGANFVTLRKLYSSHSGTEQDKWIEDNQLSDVLYRASIYGIKQLGVIVGSLETGTPIYSRNGMSFVIDEDCMSKKLSSDSYKYLVLRPDCHLYSRWDDKGSIVF